MTMKFDTSARDKMIDSYCEVDYKYNGVPIKNMCVKSIEKSIARQYIATYHYSQTMPDNTKFCYGGYLENQLVGVVCFAMGCTKNQYTSVIPTIKNGEYVELSRLWCMNDAPKNTESKLISESLKLLPKEIKLVVSFSDESEGHCGIIYQATNWYYLGKNGGGKMLLMSNGIKKHTRLLSMYKQRHPEYKKYTNKQLMDLLNCTYIDGGCKYKYVYLRGTKKEKKEMYKFIKDKIECYPKIDKKEHLLSEKEIIENFKNSEYN